jgi:DNA-binding MarR family transcriptional regulator
MENDATAGIEAARAWLRLNDAMARFNRYLRAEFGITGGQLAILRIVAESETTLLDLRRRLVMHPATLGQLVERVAKLGLVSVEVAEDDRRSRRIRLTEKGSAVLRDAPLAGPVRLRTGAGPARAARLAAAFGDAIDMFGLSQWDEQ